MTPKPASIQVGLGTPFAEQIEFLRAKLRLPTEWWDDIAKGAHDRAFIVAGAAKADLLADLHTAVARAAEGEGLAAFRKNFKVIVAKHGWTGWTGEGSAAGEAWRTRVIYQTNMATSYAAGRWKQLNDPEFAGLMPYWRYRHADGVLNPRPQHLAWDGLTLPREHAFWKTHWPPNGWGCSCKVFAVAAPEAGAKTAPPAGWDKINPATGAPVGIDKGFDYAPGANAATPLRELIDQKLIKLDAPIGAAMWKVLEPALAMERRLEWTSFVDDTAAALRPRGDVVLAAAVRPGTIAALGREGVVLDNAAIWLRDHELVHALREAKTDRGTALPMDVWRDLPRHLEGARAFLDTQDRALVYEVDAGGDIGKVVVRVNYNETGRFDGARRRVSSNFIRTGGLVAAGDLMSPRYVPLEG